MDNYINKIKDMFLQLRNEDDVSTKSKERFLVEVMSPIIGSSTVRMLLENGFCTAPASTKYHGCHEGGLFEHSVTVAYILQKYTERLELYWERGCSPILIGMIHDLCKIDAYSKVIDQRESEDWDSGAKIPEIYHWDYSPKPIVKGHGDKSVIYALQNGCQLTEEEIACIIYHMGAYETDRWSAFDNAIKTYPNVLYTHMADMEASKILGV